PVVAPPSALILVNPPSSGGPIHYVVDDQVFSLLPGEYHRLGTDAQRRIRFHRGDDFGDADLRLQQGTHQFIVSGQGWELQPADPPLKGEPPISAGGGRGGNLPPAEANLADRLLKICRPLP